MCQRRSTFFGRGHIDRVGEKKYGGVQLIAVGCMLRRLVAKIASYSVMVDMAKLLSPRQLGYGIRGGAEASVH